MLNEVDNAQQHQLAVSCITATGEHENKFRLDELMAQIVSALHVPRQIGEVVYFRRPSAKP